ncbi:MAG: ascorbate-dependent monooxygenase [Acidobacteria bacterium]|nr:ascorbate-dependent monooxygenase [Acidobacteriota bacterium]
MRRLGKRILVLAMLVTFSLIIYDGLRPSHVLLSASEEPVTFNNQIVRIFQKNCQACHHPGDIAPFSLMTYEDGYPWAQRIKEVTQSRYMPPWKPVSGCGEFKNKRGLTDEEIATIARWVDAGAPEGNPTDLPPPLEFPDGWTLGEPDSILTPEAEYMPDPVAGDVYRCFSIPTNLTEDRYITKMQLRPRNRKIVHHMMLFLDVDGKSAEADEADPGPGYTCSGDFGFVPTRDPLGFFIGGWTPGATPLVLPEGVGLFVPAHSRIVMQVHYHPTGEPESDRTQVGLYFARGPIQKKLHVLPVLNTQFVIPAGAEHYKVTASLTLPPGLNMHALAILPHMHQLARQVQVEAIYPDGTTACLVKIDDWDFHWQDNYVFAEPVPLPARTRLEMTAYYDNSANNPNNPHSPPQPVGWGGSTADEMCVSFIGVTFDAENLERSGR